MTDNIIKLPYTIPDYFKITAVAAGLRPFREGGIRMDVTEQLGKTVYHDYGHGGGGLSLAYGCAQHMINQYFLPKNCDRNEQIAVLGSGIIGITTAYLLLKQGYKVNLYAELVPFQRNKDQPQITSTVAAGYWMPLKLANKQQSLKYAISTWRHYEQIERIQNQLKKNIGITKLPTYAINDNEGLTYMPIEGIIMPKDCLVTFGDKIIHSAKTFQTYVIESQFYLPYLLNEMHNTNRYKIIKTKFSSIDQIKSLNQKHIFNCLGLGAHRIFKDDKINKGIKGHVLKFKLADHQPVKGFILFMKTIEGDWILQVPHLQSQNFNLGISYEENKTDGLPETKQVRRTLEAARNFFLNVKAHQISPKL